MNWYHREFWEIRSSEVVKAMVPTEIAATKEWRKSITKPFTSSESATLCRLSGAIDKLWKKHITDCAKIRQMTRDGYSIFGHDDRGKYSSKLTTQQKDDLFNKVLKSENVRNSSAYRRLKLVMDYWCALWFWPITEASNLPSRDEWLMELTAILEGGVYEVAPANDAGQIYLLSEAAPPQQEINFTADEYGYVNVDELCKGFPRLALVKELADRYHFHHWELEFADLFAGRGGFDLILGNPPWIKIEWNEGGILGDYEPLFIIRKLTATKLTEIREKALNKYAIYGEYLTEYSQFAGAQNYLNAYQNYPLLKGMKVPPVT